MLRTLVSRGLRNSAGKRYCGTLFDPTPEHASIRSVARGFTEKEVEPQAMEYNNKEMFNRELFRKAGDLGLLGLTADPDFGGTGMDATAFCAVHEELSRSDPAFCLSYLAHSCLFVNNLNVNGSQEQKAKYLPGVCDGSKIGGMCMTEPTVGTDVLGMKTHAEKDSDGSWILNGSKLWITNGAVSDTELGDVFLVYANTGPRQLSLFIVEKDFPGFTGAQIKNKCGMRASPTAELAFSNVRVPAENLVGGEGGAIRCMMRNLEIERVVLAAMAVGIASRSVDVMTTYSAQRTAFGKPLHNFGQIQRYIGNSYAHFQAGRAYLYNVANQMKLGGETSQRIDTDGVKLFCCPMGKEVADNAMQVLGGNGYVSDYVVERLWRDAKLLEIGGGTLESHQKNMTADIIKNL
eukprot:TRINITY_DN67838_c9_g12_i1.p1 TRINITY_DN67838_c9_g12~~TRINITY_DN67838_c9_g12_i1.p1  ORF type:complete len:406 (+),score=51.85 TRINITY_DN67838_c9_g12_i1:38-1255(+)